MCLPLRSGGWWVGWWVGWHEVHWRLRRVRIWRRRSNTERSSCVFNENLPQQVRPNKAVRQQGFDFLSFIKKKWSSRTVLMVLKIIVKHRVQYSTSLCLKGKNYANGLQLDWADLSWCWTMCLRWNGPFRDWFMALCRSQNSKHNIMVNFQTSLSLWAGFLASPSLAQSSTSYASRSLKAKKSCQSM